MWNDLKAVMAWFRGEQEPDTPDMDRGVSSLMRLVAANTMANIRKAQEQANDLPYASDELDQALPTSTSATKAPERPHPFTEKDSMAHLGGNASARRDEQEPPQGA